MKMARHLIMIIFMFYVFPIFCYPQNQDSIIIRNDSLCYFIDIDKKIQCVKLEIVNTSLDSYYVWIEKQVHSSIKERIRDYYMINKGDMSLVQMALEYNIDYGYPYLFSTFIKKVNPKETFRVYVITSNEIFDFNRKSLNYLNDHMVIVNEVTLKQYIKSLSSFNPQIFYDQSYIIIPFSLIE